MKKIYFLVIIVISYVTQAQIVNIPDTNFKAILLNIEATDNIAFDLNNNPTSVDLNDNGEIEVLEAQLISRLYLFCSNCDNSEKINNLSGIENFSNLTTLGINDQLITNINLLPVSLVSLGVSNGFLNSLDVSYLTNLTNLSCSYNPLNSLILPYSIQYLECFENNLTSLDLSNATQLIDISIGSNSVSALNLSNSNLLFRCTLSNMPLTNITFNSNYLRFLYLNDTLLSSLDLTLTQDLFQVELKNNNLSSLILPTVNNLTELYIQNNELNTIDLFNLQSLKVFHCQNNYFSLLDLSNSPELRNLKCSNNPNLTYLNIKNSSNDIFSGYNTLFDVENNFNLKYICVDNQIEEDNVNFFLNLVYNIQNCNVGTYCSFTPGGSFYTIEGNTKLDSNSNGCDISDIDFQNLNFSITDGTNSGAFISNTSGNYSVPVQAGNHTITPVLENPTYFNISPTSFVADFPTQTSPLNQDFCVTSNGVHHDVEVTIIPTNPARPGFDAHYKIIYKNKGNQIENGSVSFTYYEDTVLDLVSTNPVFNSQISNTLVWNYTNLQPFETRTIEVVFNVNSPTETPAVNIGDQLNYTATITPMITDEYQFDNSSTLKQIVVGSYDPNDKTCIEGTTVGPDMIGQYVHYVIRFENTGTYAAENVVVKDMIDLAKFDVNTLIPLHSSHDFVTRIAGNKVEFIFEGINLPFDDANNDGYIAFKIKTKPNLVVGDTFSNNASIYFDYNFPIITNTYTTTIAALSTTDFDFGTHFTLYPNPVKEVLNFQSKDNTTINSIEIYNAVGQIVLAVPNAISTVDISSLQSGNYFVKVNTDLGVSNTKFIKE